MEKQVMISISREFGSGGRRIAEKVAEDLGLPLYDRNLLDAIAKEKDVDAEHLQKFDEKPRNPILSRSVSGHSNSMEENLVKMQFEYLQKKADSGESFVVLGRCAETALKGRDGLISVFVLGDKEKKLVHVKDKYQLSDTEATLKMVRHDKKRKLYHNRYSDFKWGDSRGYDLCINSSRLGIEKTAAMIENYVKERI
mgnify:FL=1|jgi:cytidylate kinase